MLTLHDVIRKHLLQTSNIYEDFPNVDIDEMERTIAHITEEFFNKMKAFLLMGRFRYGRFDESKAYDMSQELQKRLDLYRSTRNTQYLVDIANFSFIEFAYGTHPDKHYYPDGGDNEANRVCNN